MLAKVMMNAKEVRGATAIEIAGKTARVTVDIGSELDGLLYYNSTRDGRPKLILQRTGQERAAQRYKIGHPVDGVYEMAADMDIQS